MLELCLRCFIVGLDASLKAALLALLAAAAIRLLRIRDSNVRHRVWAGVLGGMLVLPAITPLVPALGLPLALDPDWFVALLSRISAGPPGVNNEPDVELTEAKIPDSSEQQPGAAETEGMEVASVRLGGFPRQPQFEDGWEFGMGDRRGARPIFAPEGLQSGDPTTPRDDEAL